MSTQTIFYLVILGVVAVISIGLSVYTWRHRQATGAKPFSLMMLAVFVWSLTYFIQILQPDLAAQAFWNKATYFGITTTPIVWFLFALEYTERRGWVTRNRLIAVFIFPVITILMAWTNDLHHLFWATDGQLVRDGGVLLRSAQNGIWFWIHTVYSYLFLVAGTILVVRALLHWPSQYRGQMLWILLSVFAPWILNIVQIFQLLPIVIDLTPFAFMLTGLGMAFAIFRHQLLDLAPVARDVIIEGMQDGIIVLDPSERIVETNHAILRILDIPADQPLVGRRLADAISQFPDLIMQSQDATEVEVEISLGIGTEQRWVELSSFPLRDRRDQAVGRLIIIRDISARKRAEDAIFIAYEQALEANRAKSQLLARVSHELRTPLGGILGFAELLRDGVLGEINARQKDAAGSILESTGYLTTMVNELLDEAQMQAQTTVLKEKGFSPAALLDHAVSGMNILANKKGLGFVTYLDPNLPEMLVGDEQRIRQIMINLIGNAIKFTDDGEVWVRMERFDAKQWGIKVSDTGIGIPEEMQETIFEPFQQVQNDNTNENRGIGLGLAITRQLVELMGGRITLDSQTGQGSRFTILLPIKLSSEIEGE